MNSREKILNAVKANQPASLPLPSLHSLKPIRYENHVDQYAQTLGNIGGVIVPVKSFREISSYIAEHFQQGHNLLTTIDGLEGVTKLTHVEDPHVLETVELAVLEASLAVAENGAVWLSEDQLQVRVLPFICQHLAVLVNEQDIVHNMHEAYDKIGSSAYGYGAFIAGPSKTADIEQSLVLGAHGPRGMTVFLMQAENQ